MHFRAIKRGTRVVIRTPEGEKEGKALRKEGDTWLLEGDLVATPANVVRFVTRSRRGAAGAPGAPPTTAPSS
jgi:hypothetical protein